jgi:putative nucleotidyltransferase with HDIG domain
MPAEAEPTPQPDAFLVYGTFHDLLQSIVSALEARDPHTAEHSLRVADMCERTCRFLGMDPREATLAHIAAHLHDIGKIGIPDAVLLKRARRTAAEHELLRDHARIGAEIVGACAGLAPVATVVRHHHERWDGLGYPDGLRADAIPLGSRVIAVCDSVDAMLGKRLSKRPLDERACMEEIRRGSGSAYDPAVAACVLEHWDQIVGPVDFRDSADFEQEPARRALRCTVSPGIARSA